MKKWMRALALGASAAILMTVAGCSGGDSSKYNLVKDDTLTVGTNAEFPPFEFRSGDAVDGVDAAVMKAVADKLGLKLDIQDMAFESLDGALTSEKVDIIAAGYTIRSDRLEKMDFTDTYYKAEQTIIVRSDSGYKSKDDLKDKKIGGQSSTTGLISAAVELTKEENIKGYSNGAVAIEDLINGKLDAVIIDNNPAKAYKEQHSDKLTLINGQFEQEEYAYAVRKGNSELQKAVNEAMKELKDSGKFDEIIGQYIK